MVNFKIKWHAQYAAYPLVSEHVILFSEIDQFILSATDFSAIDKVAKQEGRLADFLFDETDMRVQLYKLEQVDKFVADGILVADRSHVQNIKGISRKIVQKQFANMSSNLAGKRSDNFAEPQEVKRPWGSFFVLSQTDTHKVKRLEIYAHSSLSLQSHEFRSEHWVVVEGEANVQLAGHRKTLTLDQTLFVPKGVRHRIKNKTAQRLVIVETQTGTYFGEDDEVRYEDEYGRADKGEIKQ